MDTAINIGRTNKHWTASVHFGKSKPVPKAETKPQMNATTTVPTASPKKKDSVEAWATAAGLVMFILLLGYAIYWLGGMWSEGQLKKKK